MKTSGVSLMELWKTEQERGHHLFSYKSLMKHVHKHQFLDEQGFNDRHLRQIANQAEKTIVKRAIHSKQVWDTVIDKAMEELEAGGLEIDAKDLLRAAKDKSDYELKQTDQQIAIAEMVFHFASGESNLNESAKYDRRLISSQGGASVEDFDPTDISAGSAEERRDRSSAFYQRVIGTSTPSGAD